MYKWASRLANAAVFLDTRTGAGLSLLTSMRFGLRCHSTQEVTAQQDTRLTLDEIIAKAPAGAEQAESA